MARIFVESDFELLPSIPSNWTIQKNKRIYSKTKYIVGEEFDKYQLLSLTKEGIKEIEVEDNKGKRPNDYGTYQRVNKGDLILCLYDLDVSAVFVGYSDYDGIISPSYLNLSSTSQVYNKYSYYWFLMNFYDRRYKIFSKSIRYTINNDNFMSLSSPLPPLDEQILIAKFLDKKVEKINELIQVQEDAITKLEEYRQSVITQIIQNGLNKEVETVQNNYRYLISEIPKGSKIVKLSSVSFLITDGVHQTPTYVNEGIPFVSIKDISQGFLDFSECKYVSLEAHEDLYKSTPVKRGDILFCRIGTLGKPVIVNVDFEFDIFVSLGLIKLNNKLIHNKYFTYLMNADYYMRYVNLVKAGGGTHAAKYNLGDVRNSPVILPLMSEQLQIADLLDKKTKEIDQLIQIKKDKIEKLNEYKKSLIYEAVTGKIEVM